MVENKYTLASSLVLFKILEKMIYEFDENGNPVKEREIPFNILYKLQRSLDLFGKDYAYYESERSRLVKQYGTEDPEKKTVTVTEENLEAFKAEMDKVTKIEVTHKITKLTPEEVSKINVTGVSTREMDLLMALLIEDPDFENELNTEIKAN